MTCLRCAATAAFAALTAASPAADWEKAEKACEAAGVDHEELFRRATGYGGARDPIDIDGLCERLMKSLGSEEARRDFVAAVLAGDEDEPDAPTLEDIVRGMNAPPCRLLADRLAGRLPELDEPLGPLCGKTEPAPAPSFRASDVPRLIQDGARRGAAVAIGKACALLREHMNLVDADHVGSLLTKAVAEELGPVAPADLCGGCLAEPGECLAGCVEASITLDQDRETAQRRGEMDVYDDQATWPGEARDG